MINWTPYGPKREKLLKSSFDNYIDIKFEDMNAMIISDYDRVLKNVFGDYMKLPPKKERITHHAMKMYRKNNDEE